jgi:aspartyl protease family protein
MRRVILASLLTFSLTLFASPLRAQESESGKYSPEVVAKADKILEGVGLRRTGKSIQSKGMPAVSRAITSLTREKRELRLVYQDWKRVDDRLATIRRELQLSNVRYGELNLQLARVAAGDVTTNNRIVGLINATNAQMKVLATERERLKAERDAKRAVLNKVESVYAETVLAIRGDFSDAHKKLAASLKDENVKIALRVLAANFETPEAPTADKILASLDKRIQRIEQEVFSETIPLEVKRGSLYVDVVVGKQTRQMVVDSGATMISLPLKTATELGITVPVDAREMKLVLADGRSIPARGVTLAKVRVGEFEVENVDAAVLDAVANDAEPLLGLSFLGNFKFEINKGEKTLKLLRVDAD